MKNIKSFQDYNEKIDLKKALIGGALVTSLMGCNPKGVIRTEHYPKKVSEISAIQQDAFKELTIYFTK